jgi:hypothetical protein
VAVDHHVLARGAAEQLVERQAGDLSLDVPQGHVDGSNGRHRYRPAPPIGTAIEILPDILDAMGVAADQAGNDMVGQIARDGELAAVERSVADPRAVFGLDLQRHECAPDN